MGLKLPPPMTIDPIDEGSHQAIITQLIDKGHQREKDYNTGEPIIVHKVHVCFELPHELDSAGKRRQISQTYTLSTGRKANLRKLLNAAFGKTLTDEEIGTLDPSQILGKNVSVQVEQYEKKAGGKGSKVVGASALVRGMTPISPEGKLIEYDIDSGPPPDGLPDWLVKSINESLEKTGEPIPVATSQRSEGGNDSPDADLPPLPSPPEFDEFDGEEVKQPEPARASGKRPSKSSKK